jgi:hypothetical protein
MTEMAMAIAYRWMCWTGAVLRFDVYYRCRRKKGARKHQNRRGAACSALFALLLVATFDSDVWQDIGHRSESARYRAEGDLTSPRDWIELPHTIRKI